MKKYLPGRIAGMALRHLVIKPATVDYPFGPIELIKNYRGKLIFDPETCINCKLCERDCPTGAILMVNEGTKENRKMKAILDLDRCIFCCQCVDSCAKNSLSFTQKFDLAQLGKADLKGPI